MATFIKTGFWNKKKVGTAGELNLDNLITQVSGEIINIGLSSKQDILIPNDTDAASILNVGKLRYHEDANNSYLDMSMKTGVTTYEWVNISQNNF